MKEIFERIARDWIVKNLKKCTVKQIELYKRILNIKDKNISIEDIVKKIPTDRLDNDIALIERTLGKEAALPDSKEEKLISQTTKMLNDHSKVLACICDTDSNENEYDHEFFICNKGESDGTVSGLDIKKMEDVAIWELSVEEAIKLGLKSIESIYNKPPERTTKED